MNYKLQQVVQAIVPFMVIGIAISLVVGLLIMFSYVLVWGVFLGGILWIAAIIKNFLFPPKPLDKNESRIIEHDDR